MQGATNVELPSYLCAEVSAIPHNKGSILTCAAHVAMTGGVTAFTQPLLQANVWSLSINQARWTLSLSVRRACTHGTPRTVMKMELLLNYLSHLLTLIHYSPKGNRRVMSQEMIIYHQMQVSLLGMEGKLTPTVPWQEGIHIYLPSAVLRKTVHPLPFVSGLS